MHWKLAWRNLRRNLRRSFSTGISIAVGFVALNLLGAYIMRSYETLRTISVYMDQRGHVQIQKKGSTNSYDQKPKNFIISQIEQDEIQKKIISKLGEDVEFTGKVLSTGGLLSNGEKSHPVYVAGVDIETYSRSLKHPMMKEHGFLFMMDWQKDNPEGFMKNPELIAVTPLIAEIMNFKTPLDSNLSVQIAGMTLDGDLNAVNADLGALHSTGAEFLESSVILAPIQKIQELLSTDGVRAVTLFLKSFSLIERVHQKADILAKDLSFEVEVFDFDSPAINDYFQGSMGFLYVMGSFFLILICTAVSLTIVNSLTMGIIERTREIGALRAIGFRQADVKSLFIKESLFITIISISVGTVLSSVISTMVNHMQIKFLPPGTPNEIPFTLLWSYKISIFTGIVLVFVSYISAQLVIRNKLRSKLISLLNDSGE